MSNIGFIENCANYIQKLFNEATAPPPYNGKGTRPRCRSISESEKESYVNLVKQIELMKKYNEIEDEQRFKKAYKIILECDLTNVTEIRKRIAKGR